MLRDIACLVVFFLSSVFCNSVLSKDFNENMEYEINCYKIVKKFVVKNGKILNVNKGYIADLSVQFEYKCISFSYISADNDLKVIDQKIKYIVSFDNNRLSFKEIGKPAYPEREEYCRKHFLEVVDLIKKIQTEGHP